jgi:hypothetical protein
MNTNQPPQESVDRFLKASEELMRMGATFSENIEAALEGFKFRLEPCLRTHFVEKAVTEMVAQSLSELEREVRNNLDGINRICTEGSQWYAFCFGTVLGREVRPPANTAPAEDLKAKSHGAKG